MKRTKNWLLLPAIVIALTFLFGSVAMAQTTPVFKANTLAKGTFGEIDIFRQLLIPGTNTDRDGDDDRRDMRRVWLSIQKTRGDSDVYVQDNTWDAGAATTWHTHPGHSLIIVTKGTVTEYDGHDPNCTPHVYTVGQGFVDPGGDHVHIIRNEGNVPAETFAVQLIPKGASRKTDVSSPGNCPF